MSKPQQTVLIVGGSVAGLTLANMLENSGIHYTVLEAYDEIAPQVGASIGLLPNGLRILDQLGCADQVMSLIDRPIRDSYLRNPDGSLIKHYSGIREGELERYGHHTSFIDRQMFLEILYNNLKRKAWFYLARELCEVYRGDVLVGADGIHSTVREEMWRIGNELSPGYFPVDEWSTVPCHYRCIFGISRPVEALLGGIHYVHNHNFSYLVLTGPGERVYWFLFVKLPVPLYGNDIPRYTKDDEARLAQEHALDQITTTVRFGHIYEARTSSTLTPLHEHVFQKWHFGRIMTIGDAAHKFHPLTGHGGNAAIETAAALVNHLLSKMNLNWSDSEIDAAFSVAQNDRHDRVSWLVADAHEYQQRHALATPLWRGVARVLPLFINGDAAFHISAQKCVGASRLDGLPVVKRQHSVPYDDELPKKPLRPTWLLTGLEVMTQGILYRLSNKLLLPLQVPTTFEGAPLRDNYTGIGSVDKISTVLVSVFGVPLAGHSKAGLVQWVSFTPLLLSTTFDWTTEAYRAGAKGLLTSLPTLFETVYQLLGVGRISPLYHLISVLEHAFKGPLGTVIGHPGTKEVVDAVIPSLGFGYILPTALMLWPFENKDTWQKFVALWQPFPIYVGVLVAGLSTVFHRQKATAAVSALKMKQSQSSNKSIKQEKAMQSALKLVYSGGAVATAFVHLWTVYRVLSSSDLSFSTVFGNPSFLLSGSHASTSKDDVLLFFQRDMLLNAASVLAHNVFRILHLRSLGYVTTKQAVVASLVTVVAQPIVGPAAAHIGFLGWREDIFTKIQQ
ncbi:FAD-binding-3 domain-containing protein [Fusarium sp. LHS14.1]|nr:FAD-binding-3 domain-containing protein [Fusarium sp. LHS14.1]